MLELLSGTYGSWMDGFIFIFLLQRGVGDISLEIAYPGLLLVSKSFASLFVYFTQGGPSVSLCPLVLPTLFSSGSQCIL